MPITPPWYLEYGDRERARIAREAKAAKAQPSSEQATKKTDQQTTDLAPTSDAKTWLSFFHQATSKSDAGNEKSSETTSSEGSSKQSGKNAGSNDGAGAKEAKPKDYNHLTYEQYFSHRRRH